jgi:Rieske Fe-S protein
MISRRRFIKTLGLFTGLLITAPARLLWASSFKLSLERNETLQSVGGSAVIKVKGQEVLFIRDSKATIQAFDPTCTHRGCKVAFNPKKNRIECPCHGSAFDLKGNVLKGPAKGPLQAFTAKLQRKQIVFSF